MTTITKSPVYYTYRMPYGKLTIASNGSAITNIALGEVQFQGTPAPDNLTNECANQMSEYFAGKRTVFDVPFILNGTDFQMRVWQEVAKIPYSHTCTSRDIAQALGEPAAFRQVGTAVAKNPLVVLVPGHRVIPENGYVDKKDPSAKKRAALRELERKYAI